jgi:aminoglycoside phosphotransferase (APT) family kinase protein
MNSLNYLGHLPKSDPLYEYLRCEILPQLGSHVTDPVFKVYGIPASNHVYAYEETDGRVRVIGKFFGDVSGRSLQRGEHLMKREFNNLNHLRSLGFNGYPHYVARPLGYNGSLNCVLVEEYCYGTPLDDFIVKAIQKGAREVLFQKLTALAYFLARLHNRTAIQERVEFGKECSYFDKIMNQLTDRRHLGSKEARGLYLLKDRWREKSCMWEDQQVLVHGDVTPNNLFFGDGLWVIVVDLERMKPSDRVFDLGRMAGELKHFFMQYAGNGEEAEPFIGHFLWEYACHFPDRDSAFASITRRVPFYMGLNLLRIARNSWVTSKHRKRLLREARGTLEF